MTLSTAANSAIPAFAFRKKPVCDSADAKGHAAGTVIVAPDGSILLLRRSKAETNFGGHWALPGGGVDDGETPEQGAAREMREEIGAEVEGKRKLLDQRRTPTGMVFHTFVQPAAEKFAPKLNDEHSGYDWATLDDLPKPLHPAVEATLKERIGIGEDMQPEDWNGLREGFLKWIAEEEQEPEHIGATDSALALALDRDTVREKRRDGQLVVKRAHITKANVCPYRGREVPGWEKLGLDPDRIYNLFRDPEELKKAAPTLNGVQLLIKHIPVNAEDHRPHETVGSLGTDAEFVEENGENYLDNSLFVNAKHAIDAIESGKQRELSAGYHYTPDMTPGNFRGTAFDGTMRNIVFNHVALVEDGRAGPDVVVGDSAENVKMTKPTRLAVFTLGLTSAAVAPLLAMDSKASLPSSLFKDITSKNFKASKPKIIDAVKLALDGKLRKGLALDASAESVKTVLDALEGVMPESMDSEVSEEEAKAMEAAALEEASLIPGAAAIEEKKAAPGYDSEKMMNFLREKGMGEDDIKTVCDMLPPMGGAIGADEDDEEAKKRAAAEKAAKEKEGAMDTITKPAMDAALKAQADHFNAQLAKVRDNERGVRAAIAQVKPWVGDLPATMAFDSAADVFRHALVMREVKGAKDLHADALFPILNSLPKAGTKAPAGEPVSIAMDASTVTKAIKLAPGLENIQPA